VVAVDNLQAGRDLGRWTGDYVRQHMDGSATVLDLTHHLSNTNERSQGFIAGLREIVPDARVALSIDAQARGDTARQLTRDALAVHPSINVIFAINDTTAAGALAACRDLRVAPAATLLVTFGLEGDTMKDALASQEYCRAGLAMFPEIVGPVCVEAAIQATAHRSLPAHLVTPHTVLTAETLPEVYECTPDGWRLRWKQVVERLSIPLPIEAVETRRGAARRSMAFVVPFGEHEWYHNLGAAMRDHAARQGIELEVVDAAQSLRDEIELRKCAIAQRAVELVKPGDVLIVDDGQVTVFLAEALRTAEGITVITNSVGVFDVLRHNPRITLISTGGLLRPGTRALIGPTAEATLADLRADTLFLATTGISLDFGLSHPDLAEVSVKKMMIQAAREVVLLADHSKFEGDSVVQLAPIDAVDKLVTDSALPASIRLELSKRGVEIILAET
jgi:DeoR/GlpR family transcriptional regulator of sugar metabolism